MESLVSRSNPRYSTVVVPSKHKNKNLIYFAEKSLQNKNRRISEIFDLNFIGLKHELRHTLAYEILNKYGMVLPTQATIESESIVVGMESSLEEVEMLGDEMRLSPNFEHLSTKQKSYLNLFLDNICLSSLIFERINVLNDGIIGKYIDQMPENISDDLNHNFYKYEANIDNLKSDKELTDLICKLQLSIQRSKIKYLLLAEEEKNQIKIFLGAK